jgi:hypothetical protein
MAQDTLIVLCKTLNDAMMASSQLERKHDLNRLFIFLGRKPQEKDLKWMGNTDSSFSLERTLEWSLNPEIIGIRAGLTFANGWDLIFCWADNCPTTIDVDWVRGKLKTDGVARLANVWGLTRDHYILHGLGEDIQLLADSTSHESSAIVNGLNIADALDGKPVGIEIAMKVLQEVIAISPLAVHESALRGLKSLVEAITNTATYIDDVAPVSALIGEDCDEATLVSLKQKIANHGTLIQVATILPAYTFKPYRTILITDGSKIALYGK